ncbi:MAG: hypothetical protein M3N12_10880 [Verrucomicrobiota bacterium]|nr:hypothetical protein [Verrucomicrobiota bacterium]
MKRIALSLVIIASVAMVAPTLEARTPKSKSKKTQTNQSTAPDAPDALAESANGWSYSNGVWVHPEGYKFVNGKILRTTAKTGKAFPKPPGKLALENASRLTQKTKIAPKNTQSEAERKAEERRKNLTPIAAPQTGTHM